MQADKYPFAKEFITDAEGNIRKVVIDFTDYKRMVEAIEDKALIMAMKEVEGQTPLSLNEALAELEKE
ncbi:MAG: hypothetical protein KI793_02255 [Rivularia sp. (in: Bacteria)]|nr:hypothetical protein [Rivularia sp. MS3]